MRVAVRAAIERVVEEELTGALGPCYGRPAGRTGYRHGTKTRQVTTPTGPMPLTIPRARLRQPDGRTGEWQSKISRIVQGLRAEVTAWQQRPLADLDLVYLYLDGFHLEVRVGGRVSSVPILAVLGVQRSGQKVVVHCSLRGGESTEAWAMVCEDLAARGVRAQVLCIIDGSKELRAAVERTWPQAAIQRCTVRKLRNLLTAAPTRLHDELRADYHAIVLAEDGARARRAYTAFVKTWGTSVKDAHVRYANLETSYLLQRLERYRGVAILATNSEHKLAPAFQRRIRATLRFRKGPRGNLAR